jgi:ribosomal protein L40E
MALARHDDEHQDSSRMTEAFHRTFNFCMTCRQYACDRCWNERVGACLSCSPEPGTEIVPLDDHMIVRTPVAHWDTDWSAFAEDLAAQSAAPDVQPVRFDAPIRLEEPVRLEEPHAATPPAWPVMDLPEGVPGTTGGTGAKSARRATRKAVDPLAASLWPLADEIAPEMTLTPEELELVELQLSQGETVLETAPEPDWIAAAPAPWEEPHSPAADAARTAARTDPGTVPATVPATAAETRRLPASEPERVEDREAVPTPQPELGRILSMPMPSLPPPAPLAPAPQAHERTPIVARLLGRHGPQAESPKADQPHPAPASRGAPAGDPWPQPTKWGERPIGTHDRHESDAPATGTGQEQDGYAPTVAPAQPEPAPSPAPAAPATLPAPLDAVAQAPLPRRAEPTRVGARSAAEVRLSAVSAGPVDANPADSVPDMASLWSPPAAPEPPQSTPAEAIELRPRKSSSAQERATGEPAGSGPQERVEQGEPPSDSPTPWPPLGASWPARESPGAPWPAPQVPVPAIVAAQQTATPTLDEMWAQSAQQVLTRGSVRVCHRCALPVSTQARFCRRCGTKQA